MNVSNLNVFTKTEFRFLYLYSDYFALSNISNGYTLQIDVQEHISNYIYKYIYAYRCKYRDYACIQIQIHYSIT